MKVELITGDRCFEDLAEEWNGLVQSSMTDTPFQRLGYQRSWWRHLGLGSLQTIAVREDVGTLAGIACLNVHEGRVRFNGCVEETDYLDLVAREEVAESVWAAVFDCLRSSSFPEWEVLDFCNVPAGSATRKILPRLAGESGFSAIETESEVCPIIKLPDTFDDYLSRLDKKQRHEIRRKLRKADAAGSTVRAIGPDENLTQAVNEFLELLKRSTSEKEAWLTPERRQHFHDIAIDAQQTGSLQLLFQEIGGQKASALFNFDYDNRVWVYNSGIDIKIFGHLSPGVVLTASAIEMAISRGRTEFDFLRGDEVYKYRFGAVDTEVYRIEIRK